MPQQRSWHRTESGLQKAVHGCCARQPLLGGLRALDNSCWFQKGFKSIYIKIWHGFIDSHGREGTLVLCCYPNKLPHTKAVRRTQASPAAPKFCMSSCTCQKSDVSLARLTSRFQETRFPSGRFHFFRLLVQYPFLQPWGSDLHPLGPLPAPGAHHPPTSLHLQPGEAGRSFPGRVLLTLAGSSPGPALTKPGKVPCLWSLV